MPEPIPEIIGSPNDRKRSFDAAKKGVVYEKEMPSSGDEIRGFFDKLREYADPELAERADTVLSRAREFATGRLTDYFNETMTKVGEAPGWQKVAAVSAAAAALPVMFNEEMGELGDDFLRFYYGALGRSPWPFGQYPMDEEAYRQEYYRQVLGHKGWAYIAIGVDALDFLPGISDWYHKHRPTLDVNEIPLPLVGRLVSNTVGALRFDLIDLATMYQISKETGTTAYFFKPGEGLVRTLALSGVESVQALSVYKIFPDVSFGFADCCDRVAREKIGYLDKEKSVTAPEQAGTSPYVHRSRY